HGAGLDGGRHTLGGLVLVDHDHVDFNALLLTPFLDPLLEHLVGLVGEDQAAPVGERALGRRRDRDQRRRGGSRGGGRCWCSGRRGSSRGGGRLLGSRS